MRMKKLLALAMSAVMVLGILTGCGSSKSSSSGKADSINILVWKVPGQKMHLRTLRKRPALR